jgi:hypothetical protein
MGVAGVGLAAGYPITADDGTPTEIDSCTTITGTGEYVTDPSGTDTVGCTSFTSIAPPWCRESLHSYSRQYEDVEFFERERTERL